MNFKRFAAVFLLFWFFLIIIVLLGSGSTGYYLYKDLKNSIRNVENSKISIIQSLADASVIAASIDDEKERKIRLDEFYTDPGNKKFFDKAFLVSNDGTIISHSNPAEAKELNYNIASDEFRYNTDTIFEILKKPSEKVIVNDYFIIGSDIPFSKKQIRYLKEYIYPGVDRNGWIVSRVFNVNMKKGQNINYVSSFIVSKEDIYDEINNTIHTAKKSFILILSGSFVLSFTIALVILIVFAVSGKKSKVYTSAYAPDDNLSGIQPELHNYNKTDEIILYDEDESVESNIIIQDAIPIRKRR
ncbi:MAG: hypothetical protein KA015_00100 [Spirochaetes bacterium]|nr:hypothetical protein [Spirochaetota bacterium]